MSKIEKKIELAGRTLSLETGRFAPHADSSILARYGDTIVLATVCKSDPREDLDYFPLSVDFVEKLYAGGRISTSRFVKRERLPSEVAILTSRLVDRSIRPLFPKDFFNEVQVIITVLSVDNENDPDVLSIIAASAALSISDIPWKGPIAAVRVGFKDGNLSINPVNGEMANSDLDLVISGTKEEIVMVEAGAKELSEESMLQGLEFGLKEMQSIIELIEGLQKEVGKEKLKIDKKDQDENLVKEIRDYIGDNFLPELEKLEGTVPESWGDDKKKNLEEFFAEKEIAKKELAKIFDEEFKNFVRRKILSGKRIDGRSPKEIRPIDIEVGILPRTHGSAFFKRGDTHALTIVTLGSPSLEQLIEGMEGEETKRYMHHYNFPPFSTGEVKRLGSPGRREIGHGALAERALLTVIPDEDKFPYTIRVVSEIMSSAGSTSMASVCGSTLALMDAGVPISSPVSGIAMGLVSDKNDYVILTDIGYTEDANGDMDFKVAGTKNGITAIQMDIKLTGLRMEILGKALKESKEARLKILDKILETIPKSREKISQYAPKVAIFHVEQEKIGEVIGPGGKIIRQIIAQTGASVDINDEGTVTIGGSTQESVDAALKWIDGITRQVKVGEIYDGQVKRLLPFGAFVEILPGKEGLVHVSKMANGYVSKPEDVVTIGQKVTVKVVEIDEMNRINLSMILTDQEPTDGREVYERKERPAPRFHNR